MNAQSPRVLPHGLSIQRLPTLTEVVEPDPTTVSPARAPGAVKAGESLADEPPLPTEDDLTAQVLADVQRQVDLMLEHRLREALMPALMQVTDALVLKARTELASTLREVVSRAVVQELARRR